MKSGPSRTNDSDPVERTAAEWVLRHDRGLTAAEQDEFSQWLAADQHHRAAWTEHRWGWDELDRLAGLQTSVPAVPDPDLLVPRKGRWRRVSFPRSISLLAAAVALGFGLWLYPWSQSPPTVSMETPRSFALIEQRELADGSIVDLNRGAVLTEHFTSRERRVRLERGEAHFKVAKDKQRTFVVEAAGVAVRALGTSFNVRLEPAAVEVLVTEGEVNVAFADRLGAHVRLEDGERLTDNDAEIAGPDGSRTAVSNPASSGTMLEANRRAVVSLAQGARAPEITAISAAEIEKLLAWQPRLLDFTDIPLSEIVAEFNRRNPVRVTLRDESLGRLRLSATFRSDNVEGFIRLMVSDFGMRAEWRGETMIVLHKGSAAK